MQNTQRKKNRNAIIYLERILCLKHINWWFSNYYLAILYSFISRWNFRSRYCFISRNQEAGTCVVLMCLSGDNLVLFRIMKMKMNILVGTAILYLSPTTSPTHTNYKRTPLRDIREANCIGRCNVRPCYL